MPRAMRASLVGCALAAALTATPVPAAEGMRFFIRTFHNINIYFYNHAHDY